MQKGVCHPTAEHFKVLRKLLKQPREKRTVLESLPGASAKQFFGLQKEAEKAVFSKNIAIEYLANLGKKKKEEWLRKAKRRILYANSVQSKRGLEFIAAAFAIADGNGYLKEAERLKKFILGLYAKADPGIKLGIRQHLVSSRMIADFFPEILKDLIHPEIFANVGDFYLNVFEHIRRPSLTSQLAEQIPKIQDPKLKA